MEYLGINDFRFRTKPNLLKLLLLYYCTMEITEPGIMKRKFEVRWTMKSMKYTYTVVSGVYRSLSHYHYYTYYSDCAARVYYWNTHWKIAQLHNATKRTRKQYMRVWLVIINLCLFHESRHCFSKTHTSGPCVYYVRCVYKSYYRIIYIKRHRYKRDITTIALATKVIT